MEHSADTVSDKGINMEEEIILSIEDILIPCNKQLLLKNSDYFKAMFKGNFQEKNQKIIVLKEVTAEVMIDLLNLLLSKQYIHKCHDIYQVLAACSMFLFEDLRSRILIQLEEMLSPSNCLRMWLECENLQIFPLALKAKSLSLRDFNEVRKNNTILEFNLSEVCSYLGHVNLQCDDELSVFQTAISWFHNRYAAETDSLLVLIKLLACIDFKHLSLQDILRMIRCLEFQKASEIHLILHSVIRLKCEKTLDEHVDADKCYYDDCCRIAQSFMCSKRRYFPKNPYMLMKHLNKFAPGNPDTPVYEVIYYDTNNRYLKRFANFDVEKLGSLNGYGMLDYKRSLYFFGGEYSMGKGSWNRDVVSLDFIAGKKEQKQPMPAPRRHFESCICGNHLYVVGGTGSYRIIQDNMYYYNLETDTWSKGVMLPCSGKQLKCCSHNNQLFVFSFIEKCGYIFIFETGTWKKLSIDDPFDLIPKVFSPFSLVSYKNSFFLKGDQLMQLEIVKDKLTIVKNSPLPYYHEAEFIESVTNDHLVYSVFKHREENKLSLECLDLDTLENKFIWQSIPDPNDSRKIGNFSFDSTVKLFMFHHYDLVADSTEVNCKEAIRKFESSRMNLKTQ